jgi:hypothetical protein
MPSIRVGFGTDLNITGGLTGIGTANPAARLDVAGQITVKDIAGSGGVTTFREYQGFSQVESKITNNVTIDNGLGGPYSSLTGEIKITGETTVSSGSTVEVGKTKTLTATDRFAVPLGETNNRDNAPEAGTTRFNQDFGTLEFFDGVNWKTVNSYSRGGAAGRGLFGGGTTPNAPNGATGIEYIQIHTLGNSQVFGELTVAAGFCAALSSPTRGIWGSRYTGSGNNTIDYVTIPSQGNAIDFGNSTGSIWSRGGLSSSTRGIFFGGNPGSNVIEYIEMDTLGDAIDFGDLTNARRDVAGFASATRGIMSGGNPGIGANFSVIESITIASKGNSVRFGEKDGRGMMSGSANATRGIFAGGSTVPTLGGFSNIDFVTIASEGNAVNFGDLTLSTYRSCAMASQTRAVFAHGTFTPGANARTSMDYITIASQGDAIDFGDKSETREYADGGCSDSHGGLGGF